MTCTECRELLTEYALGSLSASGAAQVGAHLEAGCAECRAELAEIAESWALVAQSPAPSAPPPHVKTALLARIESERAAPAVAEEISVNKTTARRSPWFGLALAAGLACVMVGFVGARWIRTLNQMRLAAQAGLPQRPQFEPSPVRFALLHTGPGQQANAGYVIWDALARELQFCTFGLPAAAPGNIVRLWFIRADGSWTLGQELHPDADGNCLTTVPLPADADTLRRIVVTESPPDATGPQGALRLSAEIAAPRAADASP